MNNFNEFQQRCLGPCRHTCSPLLNSLAQSSQRKGRNANHLITKKKRISRLPCGLRNGSLSHWGCWWLPLTTVSTYREREVVFPTIELGSICCKGTAFYDKHNCFFYSYSLMFIAVVSDKQLRFAAMASPVSIIPTCAAWLSAARVVARAAEAGARLPA